MTKGEFKGWLQRQMGLDFCRLDVKGQVYTGDLDTDRFSNFRAQAAILRVNPEEALMGNACKHLARLVEMIRDERWSVADLSDWDEVVGDIRCYLYLLQAMVEERATREQPPRG